MARNDNGERVEQFRLTLTNDRTHSVLGFLKFTRGSLALSIVSALVILGACVYCLIAYTPLRTYIPGYPNAHTKQVALQNAITIDSLESEISRWKFYVENVGKVINGQAPTPIDSILGISHQKTAEGDALKEYAAQDSLLRGAISEAERFQISEKDRVLPLEGISFFTPMKGVVSKGFEPVVHPYIDITAAAGSVVKAVLDGTVIYSSWDEIAGYTIEVQHSGDLISIYGHTGKLLKAKGDKVSAGSPIAMTDNDNAHGDHLHFELWHKGEAVDPAKYISF